MVFQVTIFRVFRVEQCAWLIVLGIHRSDRYCKGFVLLGAHCVQALRAIRSEVRLVMATAVPQAAEPTATLTWKTT